MILVLSEINTITLKVYIFLLFSLKLFQHLDLFRILVCGGDGSVGWVMTEIDKMNLIKKVRISTPCTMHLNF
jgi:hypothetical protein